MEPDQSYRKLEITDIKQETKDAKTFVLKPSGNWKFKYEAGQFITLVFFTRHGGKRRSYSFSSSPVADDKIYITIKKVENGEFSRFLLTRAKTGDVLYTSGIGGQFILPTTIKEYKTFFFLAAGSGITPCYALIKTLLINSRSQIILVYSNRSSEETIFYNELKQLQVKYPERIIIRFLFSNLADVYKSRLSNWLLNQLVDQYLPDSSDTLFYICGPFDYMQMAEITLLTRVPKTNIYKENFSTLPQLVRSRPPDTEAHIVTLHLNDRSYNINVQYPQTILAAAKANNIFLPYSCEAGRCSSCAATCTKGKIWMAYNEVLTDEEIKKGRVLVCQSYPFDGDAEITY